MDTRYIGNIPARYKLLPEGTRVQRSWDACPGREGRRKPRRLLPLQDWKTCVGTPTVAAAAVRIAREEDLEHGCIGAAEVPRRGMLFLDTHQLAELQALLTHASPVVRVRARIILLCGEHVSTSVVARKAEASAPTVMKWYRAYVAGGARALREEKRRRPRPGRTPLASLRASAVFAGARSIFEPKPPAE